ncbi:MAG: PAS domain S-box protein [Nitrospinae bacterium]|nr:PAS domain S-box protein [Nitrospinota bacterium]
MTGNLRKPPEGSATETGPETGPLETFMNNLADGVVVMDERGCVESLNPAAERIFGYRTEEAAGQSVHRLLPEPCRSEMGRCFLDGPRAGEKRPSAAGGEIAGLRKDGSVFPMDWAVSELFLGGRRLFVGVVRDVAERKTLENDLRKLSRAVEQSPSSVLITDAEGRIEYVNPHFVATSGYSLEEVAGKNPRILKSGVHPPQFYSKLWETITAGNEWRGELCNRRKDGGLVWELQSITPLLDAKGRITHFVSVKIDDTERKRAAEQLESRAAELERSNEALRDFAAIASHDLQEPLRKIVAFGDRLKKYSHALDECGRDCLERMQNSTLRMQKFIDDLLKYSRVASNPRQFEAVDLAETVSEALLDVETLLGQTGGAVSVGRLPQKLEGDKMLLRQLFQNLIGNALKFRGPDEPPRVEINGRYTSGGFWEISVADNGIGFDMKYLDRIFKPFQRLHGRTEYDGTGMGLTICQKVVSAHGGKLSAVSAPGKGAKFIVLLPESRKG